MFTPEHDQLRRANVEKVIVTDDSQSTKISGNNAENHSAVPTSICLTDNMERDILDKTDVESTDDNQDDKTRIQWRTRCLVNYRTDTDELSTLEDLKIQNILYKRDLYELKIRVATNKSKITLRQKRPDGPVFTTPKCYTKNITLMVHEQKVEHQPAVMNVEMTAYSLAAGHTSSVQSNESTVQDDELVVGNPCDRTYEVALSQSEILKMKDKPKDFKHLANLSVVSILQFCSDCHCHAIGLNKPNEIHYYINDDVKALLADTCTARQWGVLSIGDFGRLETEDVLLLLQDHCTPTSQTDFYNNLKSATEDLNMRSLLNIEGDNIKTCYRRYNLYAKTFRYAYDFLLENIAKRIEIPYTHTKCNVKKTLKNLFLDRLPVCFTSHMHDKSYKGLNKIKSLDNLMRYTHTVIHKLYK
jgi:hypothetical protein